MSDPDSEHTPVIMAMGEKDKKRQIKDGRPIHKRVLFHPLTVFILLCIGVLIIGWTYKVVADYQYSINAEIPAPPLTQAATITYPPDGYTSSTGMVTVTGTCPDSSYVNLYDNTVFSGVAWCLNTNTYSIQLDMYLGENDLVVQDYNVTNSPGPSTPGITVYYQPPAIQPTTPPSSKTPSPLPTYPPILLSSNFHFQTFLVDQTFKWQLTLSGGKAPFIVNINWGDGQTTAISLAADKTFTISHIYNKGGYYPIIVEAVDSAGSHKSLQLAALIKYPGQTGFLFSTNGRSPPKPAKTSFSFGKLFSDNKWLVIAWPVYIIILLMATSFWLGERQEYNRLVNSSKLK